MAVRNSVAALAKLDKVYHASTSDSDADAMNNIDTRDYKQVLVSMGISGSGGLTSANTMGFSIQHSDTTTAGDYEDVPVAQIEVQGGNAPAAGELVRLTTAPGSSVSVHQAAYKGEKRYLRIGPKQRGSVSGNYTFICTVNLLEPRNAPVA